MITLIRIGLVLLTTALVYVFAQQITSLPYLAQFGVATIGMLTLGYFHTGVNIWARKHHQLPAAAPTDRQRLTGHALMAIGALCCGYAFASRSTWWFLPALGCLWFADDSLNAEPKTNVHLRKPRQKTSSASVSPGEEALMREVARRRKQDPQIGIKLGGQEVFQRLLGAMKDSRGVHMESLLTALGALAGYACQAAARAQTENGQFPAKNWHTVQTASGDTYFFSEDANRLLVGTPTSVWNLAAAAAQHSGAKSIPDPNEVFSHVAGTVGDPSFGVPRIPEGHTPRQLPREYLDAMWAPLSAIVKRYSASPMEWPATFSVAIQQAIQAGQQAIDPSLALSIVMESAVPMSKINLRVGAT